MAIVLLQILTLLISAQLATSSVPSKTPLDLTYKVEPRDTLPVTSNISSTTTMPFSDVKFKSPELADMLELSMSISPKVMSLPETVKFLSTCTFPPSETLPRTVSELPRDTLPSTFKSQLPQQYHLSVPCLAVRAGPSHS